MTENKTSRQRFFSLVVLLSLLVLWRCSEGWSSGCECPHASVSTRFPSVIPNDSCCLNFSGSFFNLLPWSAFTAMEKLQILDLSFCNLTEIEVTAGGRVPPSLRELYLNQNRLTSVPEGFLADVTALEVLDLRGNLLEKLPENFLGNAEALMVLMLGGNRLHSLPAAVLRPSLRQLDLAQNPWACTCQLVEELQGLNRANSTSLESIVGNVTCTSPHNLAGRSLWSVQSREACRSPGLTALFIVLPLVILLGLILCWCCGRKEERKEYPNFGSARKKLPRPDRWPRDEPFSGARAGGNNADNAVVKNQLMLRPSSALLGSTRDVYEEVEVKLGSVHSLATATDADADAADAVAADADADADATKDDDGKAELDAVSVTEVMKDSADREKVYMMQPRNYYSLVPGIEMDDSDHGEYENVDLA